MITIPARPCIQCGKVYDTCGKSQQKKKKYCSLSCAQRHIHGQRKSAGLLSRNYGCMKHGYAPTEHPTNYDIAWAAGLYEGEGSRGQTKPGHYQLSLGQKDRWVCDRLCALFGGSVSERKFNDQPFYEWHLSGPRARGFAMTIYSFLSPRRQGQMRPVFAK